MKGTKKGNVDADIIFSIMKRVYKQESFDKVLLVSGDGDYKMLVDFLIEENKFEKVLFPKQQYVSSLYKSITRKYFEKDAVVLSPCSTNTAHRELRFYQGDELKVRNDLRHYVRGCQYSDEGRMSYNLNSLCMRQGVMVEVLM